MEREGGKRRRREKEKEEVVGEWKAAKLSIVLLVWWREVEGGGIWGM